MAKNSPDYILTGNTYAHREAIKDAGGKWDPALKAWIVPNGTTMRERQQQAGSVRLLANLGIKVSRG